MGTKLSKTVSENGTTKTTEYVAGGVFEGDTFYFLSFEEGRIRYVPPTGAGSATLAFDYMLKDHLGNVRMVLTDEQKTMAYPPASLEDNTLATEQQYYHVAPSNRKHKNTIPNYPADGYTSPNNYVHQLNGNSPSNAVGSSIVLRVMSGDKVNIRATSWYADNATPQSPNNSLPNILAGLASGLQLISNPLHAGGVTSMGSGYAPGLAAFLLQQTNAYNGTRPKAYLNYILFDEQFKLVSASSGMDAVDAPGVFKEHIKTHLPITKNGYLYVYVSNETPNINVFFDNLQVTHIAGPLVEETHYYPFGLTMAGISSRAASSLENRKKFNDGTELASKEFSDGSGLELYETNYRSLDPQIGRFLQVDPLADISVESSPFSYAYNNPILLNDPLGLIADSTDKKGNVWHGLPDVLVTSSKKPSNKTFNQIADFGFSLGWNSRIRINNYVNILANARREYEAGTMLLEDASWLRYTSLVKSREQLTLSGKFLSQLFKSNPKAYQDYLRYLQNLKDKNFARQLSVFTPNQNWTKVARLGKILGPGIQIGAELFEYTTIISQQKTIDQVEDDYDSWFNPVMKLWRPIENYLKTLGPKK